MRKWLRRKPFAECWNRSEVAAVALFIFLNYSQCVCYLGSTQRVCFCSWAVSFLHLLVLFQYTNCHEPFSCGWLTTSSLSGCFSHSCLAPLVVCLLSSPSLLVLPHFLFHHLPHPARTWLMRCVLLSLLMPRLLSKMSMNCPAGIYKLSVLSFCLITDHMCMISMMLRICC